MENNTGLRKYLVIYGFAFFILITSIVAYFSTTGKYEESLYKQEMEIHSLEKQLDAQKEITQTAKDELIESSTGLQTLKVDSDNKVVEAFMDYVLTWDDGASYDAMRNDLLQSHGPVSNDNFFEIFLPENVSDSLYNYIDVFNLNSRFESLESYVTQITPNTYSYFSFVEFSSRDKNGTEGTSRVICTYDVDSDNNILNLDAYTISH